MNIEIIISKYKTLRYQSVKSGNAVRKSGRIKKRRSHGRLGPHQNGVKKEKVESKYNRTQRETQ